MYEITYFYYDRKEDGSYDTSEKKELKKKLGAMYDDTPLEKLAAAVLAQLARRDVWVVDASIQEYVKREVSFKESKDGSGIVLKGKKFSLGDTAAITVEEVAIEEAPRALIQDTEYDLNSIAIPNPRKAGQQNLAPPPPVNPNRIMYHVIFTPELGQEVELKRFKLTNGNRYPVHRQTPGPMHTSVLSISDDRGQIINIDEKYFSVAGQGLIGGSEFNQPEDSGNLLYHGGGTRKRKVSRDNLPEEYRNLPIEGESDFQIDFNVPELRPGFKP